MAPVSMSLHTEETLPFVGRTVVVTGGSVGIGYAIAERCAAQGADLVLIARNREELESARRQIAAKSRGAHEVFPLDVSDLSAVREFGNWLKRRSQGVFALINSAGIYGPIGKTVEVSAEEFARALEINFLGTVYMCQAVAPALQRFRESVSKPGVSNPPGGSTRARIISLAGGGAASPFPFYSAYATSKAALVRLTENLALELEEDGVDVNCIAPGFVITRLHQQTLQAGADHAGSKFFKTTEEQISKGGVPPEKTAELVTFLLSAAGDGVSGRFLSAPWDPWQDPDFVERLRTDKDLATLRRIDNQFFVKKGS